MAKYRSKLIAVSRNVVLASVTICSIHVISVRNKMSKTLKRVLRKKKFKT